MTRRRAGGWSSALVLAWLCAGAIWLGRSEPPPDETPANDAAPRARLQAVAVEPPSPADEPGPEPPSRPEPAPAEPTRGVTTVAQADRARGEALLSDAGGFPVLSASYQGMHSFGAYAKAMAELGARFVVVQHRRIVGEIDLARGDIREPALAGAFSPRARDYSHEPALRQPARRARERFGADAEIMLLVPRALDAGLFGGIARELARRGEDHAAFREIEGRYEPAPDGGLRFSLEAGVRMDGRRVPLEATFDLDAMASAGASG